MEGFVKFPKIKFVLLKINPPSAVKGKEGEMRLPQAPTSLCRGFAVLIVWTRIANALLTLSSPICHRPHHSLMPYPPCQLLFIIGLVLAFSFLVEVIGKRNNSYVSVKNQKSKRYTNRDMCFKENESGSIFLWGTEKYSQLCITQGILEKRHLNALLRSS